MIEHGKNNEMSNLDDSAKWVLMFETSITVHRISASRVIKTWKHPSFKTLLLSLIKMHVFSINPNFSIKNIKIHFHSLQINLHNTHIQVQTAITRGGGGMIESKIWDKAAHQREDKEWEMPILTWESSCYCILLPRIWEFEILAIFCF